MVNMTNMFMTVNKKSKAKSTIEFAIINGLSQNAHITHASANHSKIFTKDLIESLFHPSVRWAIKEYLKELNENTPDWQITKPLGPLKED